MSDVNSLREELIKTLSDDEIARLVQEMRSGLSFHHEEGANFLRAIKARHLFGFLHFKVFGHWCNNGQYAGRVMESVNEVREFINRLPSTQVFRIKDEYPVMPQDLCIRNEIAGVVFVKQHAWERFIERWHKRLAYRMSSDVAKTLQWAFVSVTPTILPKRHSVRRIMLNDFQQAEYYMNVRLQLRFVVSTEHGRKVLLTVERPYS